MTSPSEPDSSKANAAGDGLVGKRVHKYDIVRILGRGGMGTVYEAANPAIGKRVAMKFIDAVPSADAVARFQREAQAASAVESAHIVEIFDSGISEEGQPYIVMELLRGEDLGHRIKRCGRLDLPEAVHVTSQILRGLHRAHKAGIVHRDLKPDNIFLVDRDDDPNFAKILDFGISKVRRRGDTPVNTLTREGTVLGTPFYMSPEQAQAQPDVDARSDLWSVGAILYECLTGRPPYTGATYEAVIVNICMNDAEDVRVYNPGVPEGVAHVLARALARDREERFADARELMEALRSGAGLMPSSRGGSSGEDSFPGVTSSDPGAMPVSSGRTPRTPSTGHVGGHPQTPGRRKVPTGDPALDATVRYQSTPAPDGAREPLHVTRRRAEAARRRRTFVLVAVGALVTGALGAFLVARTWLRPSDHAQGRTTENPVPSVVTPGEAPRPPATTEETARPAPASTSAVVPVVEPVPPDSGEARKTSKTAHVTGETARVPVAPVSAKVQPRPPETAAPVTSGVAPGLKLKID